MQLIEQKPETLAEFRTWAGEAIHHCQVMLDDEEGTYYAARSAGQTSCHPFRAIQAGRFASPTGMSNVQRMRFCDCVKCWRTTRHAL